MPIFNEMGTYSASLRSIGDVKTLSATIELSDGNLSIVVGDTEIGTWSLNEINLEEIPTGYRMSAEGDQVLLEMRDIDSFASELAKAGSRSKGLSLRRREKKQRKQKTTTNPKIEVTGQRRVAQSATANRTAAPPAAAPAKKGDGPGLVTQGLDAVDSLLLKAKKKYGAFLPDFLFSRAMFFIGVAVLVTGIFLPGLFSNLLIAGGAMLIAFGAVVYSDSVLASRWLPGRATPQHALLTGVAVLLVGVLVGVITK